MNVPSRLRPFAAANLDSDRSWWLGLDPTEPPAFVLLTLALDIPIQVMKGLLASPVVHPSTTEYQVVSGEYDGQQVTVVYHGSGALSASVAIEELARIGSPAIVRTGNSGGLAPDVSVGDIVVVTSGIREDRMLLDYVPLEYPAVSDRHLLRALEQAAVEEVGQGHVHVGSTVSVASFYAGTGFPTAAGVLNWDQIARLRLWQQLGAKNIDAETTTVLVLADLFGLAGAAVLGIGNHIETGEGDHLRNPEVVARIALNALVTMGGGHR